MTDKLRDDNKVTPSPAANIVTQSFHSDDFIPSEHVRIVVRCRPLIRGKEESASPFVNVDPQNNWIDIKSSTTATKRYKFCCVADETKDQAHIFEQTGQPIVECVLAGFNAAIVAYGQTGSGKTYTMQGTALAPSIRKNEPPVKGIVQMVCELIFNHVHEAEKSGEDKISVQSSYLEIYNETLIDLLASEESSRKPGKQIVPSGPVVSNSQKLAIREDTNGSISVVGLSAFDVATPEQCYQLLRLGADRRKVAATHMNTESSRSHAVFTLTLSRRCLALGTVRVSRLHLVDLAGSERQRATGASGMRLREAGGINKSLSALGNVINALSSRDNHCLPRKSAMSPRLPSCRESKLTFLLKDALGGNSKLCLIAAISPALGSIDETVSTLEFAKRCSALQNEAFVNEILSSDVSELQEEVRRLQMSLKSAHIGLSNSKSTMAELRRKVDAFQNNSMRNYQRNGQNDQNRIDVGTQTEPGGFGYNHLHRSEGVKASPVNNINQEDKEKKDYQINSQQEDNSRTMDFERMRSKWKEMIDTNHGLWQALMRREEEILELKMVKLNAVQGHSQIAQEEIEQLRIRVKENSELLILRHRLEAYSRDNSEKNEENPKRKPLAKKADFGELSKLEGMLQIRGEEMKAKSEPRDTIRVRKSVSFKEALGNSVLRKNEDKNSMDAETTGFAKLKDNSCQNHVVNTPDSESSMMLMREDTRRRDHIEKTDAPEGVISEGIAFEEAASEKTVSEIDKNTTNVLLSEVRLRDLENASRLVSESSRVISPSAETDADKRELNQREHKTWTPEEKRHTKLGIPTKPKNGEVVNLFKREDVKAVGSNRFADDQSWIQRRPPRLSGSNLLSSRTKRKNNKDQSDKSSVSPSNIIVSKMANRFET